MPPYRMELGGRRKPAPSLRPQRRPDRNLAMIAPRSEQAPQFSGRDIIAAVLVAFPAARTVLQLLGVSGYLVVCGRRLP